MNRHNLRALMRRAELRQFDVAWLVGVRHRTVQRWLSGEQPVPQAAKLLLRAYDQNLFSAKWLAENIDDPPPR